MDWRQQALETVTVQGKLNGPWNRLAVRESNKRIGPGYKSTIGGKRAGNRQAVERGNRVKGWQQQNH